VGSTPAGRAIKKIKKRIKEKNRKLGFSILMFDFLVASG
jgi:hypothetical protein